MVDPVMPLAGGGAGGPYAPLALSHLKRSTLRSALERWKGTDQTTNRPPYPTAHLVPAASFAHET